MRKSRTFGSIARMDTSAPARSKRFPVLPYALVLALILLFALAPVISVVIAGGIANAYGCRLDEAGVHPCVIGGTDYGEMLEMMFVLGWLMLMTLPAGAIAFLIWVVVLITHAILRSRSRIVPTAAAVVCFCFATATGFAGDAPKQPMPNDQSTTRANGAFDVNLTPQTTDLPNGRMSLDKRFHGDLDATSKGEMLTAVTAVKGSAGYVAIEQVTGTLAGKRGSFFLQHSATMNRGVPELSIIVVPDSATEELQGLTGKMTIDIAADGKHSYTFDYALPPQG